MEEEGEVSYWEVLFKANSFSDLLDRLNMVEEIAASDKRRLQELSDAANKVEEAQAELETEKGELETTKKDLDEHPAERQRKIRNRRRCSRSCCKRPTISRRWKRNARSRKMRS